MIRVAFTDPAGGSGGDSATLAVAREERRHTGDVLVLEVVREVRPPFSPEAMVAEFASVLKAYGVHEVTGDRYAGEWPREAFRRHGVEYVPATRTKSEIYSELLPLINSRRVELLDDPRLLAQLAALERRTARGGRDTIDHAPGAHDDVANAAAAALVLIAQQWGEVPLRLLGIPERSQPVHAPVANEPNHAAASSGDTDDSDAADGAVLAGSAEAMSAVAPLPLPRRERERQHHHETTIERAARSGLGWFPQDHWR